MAMVARKYDTLVLVRMEKSLNIMALTTRKLLCVTIFCIIPMKSF